MTLAHALDYASNGWPVFPIKPRSKEPLTAHGFHDASTDPYLVRAWWQRWPNANIGIATGHGCDVLDVDGPEGRAALADLINDHSFDTSGWVTSTSGRPDGGLHCWFAPTGLGRRIGFRGKMDWIGGRGYIIAPPSIHPSGTAYAWRRPPNGALPAAPPWLRDIVDPPRRPLRPGRTRPGWAKGGERDLTRLNGLLGQLETAPQGERNNRLHWAACRLAELLDDGAPIAWADLLVEAGVQIGLPENEARATVLSGLKGERR